MQKNFFYIFFLFISCSSQDNNLDGDAVDQLGANPKDSLDPSLFTDSIETQAVHLFSIEDMPSNWTALTDISGGEGEFAIKESCYGGVPTLAFYNEIGTWWFTSFSGKEEQTWEIASFDGQITDNFGSEIIKGVFALKNNNTLPSDTISFSWPTGQKMCQFTELNMPNEYFVSHANKSHYTIVDNDCDD